MNAMIAAMTIFLGCYTDDPHPCGLKTLALDVATGAMTITGEHRVSNALYQALSPDGRFLWSCTGEGLESFRIEGGKLVPVDSVGLGDCVCHVAAMPAGDRVVFADYLGGFGGSVKVAEGTFGETVRHAHTGCGPNLPRQKTAHCHQAYCQGQDNCSFHNSLSIIGRRISSAGSHLTEWMVSLPSHFAASCSRRWMESVTREHM